MPSGLHPCAEHVLMLSVQTRESKACAPCAGKRVNLKSTPCSRDGRTTVPDMSSLSMLSIGPGSWPCSCTSSARPFCSPDGPEPNEARDPNYRRPHYPQRGGWFAEISAAMAVQPAIDADATRTCLPGRPPWGSAGYKSCSTGVCGRSAVGLASPVKHAERGNYHRLDGPRCASGKHEGGRRCCHGQYFHRSGAVL